MTRPQPAWRSLLFVPVTSERFLSKAHTRGADAIILDLEDSILPAHKAAARAALPAAVPRVAQGGADVVVRINRPLDLAVADIAASVMPGVAALMLPKVMGPEHVRLLAELVTEREAALGMPIGHTRFLALIESPAALPHLFAIAAEPRMAGMSVGGEDMATELGAIPSADSMYVFAMQGLAAARTAGILPMGSMGQLAKIDDLDSYRAGLRRGRALGFTTAVLHPSGARADHQRGVRRLGRRARPRPPADRGLRRRGSRRGRRRGLRRQHDRPARRHSRAAAAGARRILGAPLVTTEVCTAYLARTSNLFASLSSCHTFRADISGEPGGDRPVRGGLFQSPSRTGSAENDVDIGADRFLDRARGPGAAAGAGDRLPACRVGYRRYGHADDHRPAILP